LRSAPATAKTPTARIKPVVIRKVWWTKERPEEKMIIVASNQPKN
jgi:hypothetical protein